MKNPGALQELLLLPFLVNLPTIFVSGSVSKAFHCQILLLEISQFDLKCLPAGSAVLFSSSQRERTDPEYSRLTRSDLIWIGIKGG